MIRTSATAPIFTPEELEQLRITLANVCIKFLLLKFAEEKRVQSISWNDTRSPVLGVQFGNQLFNIQIVISPQ